MKAHKSLAIFLVSLFFASGCLSAVTPEVEVPDIELPDDWSTVPSRSIASPQLQAFADCQDLEDALKQSIFEEYRIQILQAVDEIYYYGGGMWLEGDEEIMMAEDSAAGNSAPTETPRRVEGEDFSGTNNQESGVDEADFVKTDGYHIYFLEGQYLRIFGTPNFGELTWESNTTIEGTPQAMMLNDDQLMVLSTVSPWAISRSNPIVDAMGWDGEYGTWSTSSLTKFTVYDISNRSAPEIQRELYIEGWYNTAREVDGTVRAVTHAWMELPGVQSWLDLPTGYWNLDYEDPLRLEIREKVAYETILGNQQALDEMALIDLLPAVYEMKNGVVTTHFMDDEDCENFAAPEDGYSRGVSSIFSLNLLSDEFSYEVDHVIGNHPQVYASQDVLVLAESAFDWWWFWGNDGLEEMTNLHTFDISEPGETLYTGSGRVNGTVLNQFALSEYEGVLRVATTTGQWARWWMEDPEPMSSQLVTMGRSMDFETGALTLEELGRVDGIAPGERIWSVRFDGDRAYIVTFEQIDPLWVIDVSNETDPTILGELKVPGVSTYIHPLSRDHLLTIGLAPANEDGTGLDWSGTQISLFDVSDPTTPTLDRALRLSPVTNPESQGWQWSWSEATYESKAFQYWAPKEMLAIPLSTYRYNSYTINGEYHWNYQYVSKLILVNVNESNGNLTVHGAVDHSDLYDRGEQQYWWGEHSIRRSIFMGDFVYALSSAGVTATNLTTLEESARVAIDHPSQDRLDEGMESETTSSSSSSTEDADGAGEEPQRDS